MAAQENGWQRVYPTDGAEKYSKGMRRVFIFADKTGRLTGLIIQHRLYDGTGKLDHALVAAAAFARQAGEAGASLRTHGFRASTNEPKDTMSTPTAEVTPNADNILFLDFETTGFMTDLGVVVIEGAAIITDGDLNELAVLEGIPLHATEEDFSYMDDFVRDMHTKTGLLDRVAASTTTRARFDDILHDFAAPYFPVKKKTVLPDGSLYRGWVIGGNSVKFDFDVITRFFPRTLAEMDYRVIDISGVGELVRRWNRPAWEAMPAKASDHTALTDIREGVKELRYYRSVLTGA